MADARPRLKPRAEFHKSGKFGYGCHYWLLIFSNKLLGCNRKVLPQAAAAANSPSFLNWLGSRLANPFCGNISKIPSPPSCQYAVGCGRPALTEKCCDMSFASVILRK